MANVQTTQSRGYSADRPAVLNRIRRIEGQVRGLARMVAEDRYCIDVLTQIGAVRSALDGVGLGLLDGHVRHCVAGGDPLLLEERADELTEALAGGGRPRYAADRAALGKHLSGLVTRIGGLIHMVESDRYCIDVIEEINVVKQELDGVALGLLDGHVRTCMNARDVAERVAKADELMAAVGRLVKTT
jgi:CsoR family transcriptional regulator, copper-sensing transcriptional repressor